MIIMSTPPEHYYSQLLPTDNAVAVLQNLLASLGTAISPNEVARTVYDHPDFPFISLHHLTEFLRIWNIETRPVRVKQESLVNVTLPTIAYIAKDNGTFVMLKQCDGRLISYLHPGKGWVVEPMEQFGEHWKGIVLIISRIQAFEALPVAAKTQRTAIATTLVNAEKTLDSFIKYHLSIGFDHIFLFFDKPDDSSILIAQRYDQVRVITRDANLESLWETCKLYELLSGQLHRPQARQLLNVEIAVQIALEQGIDWLLQIDVDELFYSPDKSVQEHFSTLAQESVYHATYLNYEGLCQKTDVDDYFKEVTLFKKNPHRLTPTQRELLKDYSRSNPSISFLAYSNGKSAARIEENLLPWGNHQFQLQKGTVAYQKKMRSIDVKEETFPLILHYAECGFSHFWDKYYSWGNFPDTYLGGQRIDNAVPFRIAARDVVQTGDKVLARELYETRAVLSESEIVECLIRQSLLCRIHEPRKILDKFNEPRIPE